MTGIPLDAWPTMRLNGVRRLRVLAATLPGVHCEERDLAAPYDDVWAFLTDLERNVPRFDQLVTSLQVTERAGSHLRVVARTVQRLRVPFEVDVEPGFIWMQAPVRAYVVGLAAAPRADGGTRYAHLEGVPSRVGATMARQTVRHVRADVDAVARLLDSA
jgi:hypothetical protein